MQCFISAVLSSTKRVFPRAYVIEARFSEHSGVYNFAIDSFVKSKYAEPDISKRSQA